MNTKITQVHTSAIDDNMEYTYDIIDNQDGRIAILTANSSAWSNIYKYVTVLSLVDDGQLITITKENGDVITLGYEGMEQMLALLMYAYDGEMKFFETKLTKSI